MTNDEKLSLLEEMLETEPGSLNESMALTNIENWDSLAAISLIALFDENFNKTLSANEIRNFKSIKDILDKM